MAQEERFSEVFRSQNGSKVTGNRLTLPVAAIRPTNRVEPRKGKERLRLEERLWWPDYLDWRAARIAAAQDRAAARIFTGNVGRARPQFLAKAASA